MKPNLARDVLKRSKHIPGWRSDAAGMLFAMLDEVQQANEIEGDAFEIGCHHGKCSALLGSFLDRPSERLGVCDIFDLQDLNPSSSGGKDSKNKKEVFFRNMKDFFGTADFIDAFHKPSSELTVEETGKNVRIFHVDGGHSADEALSDIKIAAKSLNAKGVIVVDDALSASWVSVTEGIFRFLLENEGEWSALSVGFNKMVIVRTEFRNIYVPCFESRDFVWSYIPRLATAGIRKLDLFGEEVYCFRLDYKGTGVKHLQPWPYKIARRVRQKIEQIAKRT